MSDETTPQDSAAMSPASAGSHGEPIGHQFTDEYGRPIGFLQWQDAETRWPKGERVPLYLHPQPTLTDEERAAIGRIAGYHDVHVSIDDRDTLRGLLKRLA